MKGCPLCGGVLPQDGQLRIDVESNTVSFKGRFARLSPTEIEVLQILIRKAPLVVRYSEMWTALYGNRLDGGPEPKIFAVLICRIRKVLRGAGIKLNIETIWGRGFRISAGMKAA